MIDRLGLILLVFLTFGAAPAAAQNADAAREVKQVVSADEISLTDGTMVHLQGVTCCLDPDDDHATKAKTFLQSLINGNRLAVEGDGTDRYGRPSGAVFAIDPSGKKIWLQGEMLNAGMAFVYPPRGDELYLDDMRIWEAAARQAKRGIWADPRYADTPADSVDSKYGKFAFVSGRVLKAERIKNKVYLNFGDDWRTDFTVAIAAHDLRFFKKANSDPLSYEGKIIRVRGWVKRDFGPMITVTHPSQIEVLDEIAVPN